MTHADGCQESPVVRKSPGDRAAEIRAAAEALVRESGLGALSLRSLARRVGVTSALVSHYCPSMESTVATVFGAVVGRELSELVGSTSGLTPTDALRAAIRFVLDDRRDDITVVWLDAWSLGRHSTPLADEVRNQMDAWQSFLAGLIAAGNGSGEFHSADPELSAWQLLALTDGLNAHVLVRAGDRAVLRSRVAFTMEHELGLRPGVLA